MQCSEPEKRHFLQITLCNKASHFSILKKNKKPVNMNVLNFSLGFKGQYHSPFSKVSIIHHFQRSVSFTIFKGLYHSPFSKVCIIHHFQRSVSFTIFKEQDQNLSQRKSYDRWPDTIWQFNDPSADKK